MNRKLRLVLDVVLRGGVLAAAVGVLVQVWQVVMPEPIGADIGMGLAAFALLVVLAGVWGALDARSRPFGRLAVTWAAVGLLCALAVGSPMLWQAGSGDPTLLLVGLVTTVPFTAALVVVPALVGGAIASALIERRVARF